MISVIDQDISRCLTSTKGVLELIRVDSIAHVSKIASSTRLESSSLDRVWIESTRRRSSTRRLQFVFSLLEFRSCVMIDSVDMLKFTHTHTHKSLKFVFGLTGLDFI